MRFAIRHPQEDVVYCDGTRTVCKLSATTQQPTPWTPAFRDALEACQDNSCEDAS
jgi:acyl-CoA thioesterase FadM